MRRSYVRTLLVSAALIPGASLDAAPSGSSKNVTATLVADVASVEPGQPFQIGIRLKMAPEWHTYWLNPGDSGLPTKVAWTLPDGFTVSDLRWPVPERIVSGPLASYGYHDEVLLTAVVTPPAAASGTVPVAAKVSWLECKEACLPGKAQLDLALPGGPARPSAEARDFAATATRWPAAAKWDVEAARSGSGLVLRFTPDKAPARVEFYPAQGNVVEHAGVQTTVARGRSVELTVPLDPNGKLPERLTGVLVAEPGTPAARGIEVDVPVGAAVAASGALGTPAAAVPGALPVPPASEGVATGTTGSTAAGRAPMALSATSNIASLPLALAFAFVGGLILNLMPCVLPVLSLKVLSFVKHAGDDPRRAWRHGAAFTVGVLLSFWALAGVLLALRAAGEQIGWGFQLQSPSFVVVLTGLFFLMGLNLFGVFEVGTSLTAAGGLAAGRSGLGSSFWGGALATIVATPCTAPFMGSALGFGLSQPAWAAMATFTALGLGMATPYMLLSVFPRLLRFVPRSGPWMHGFKQLMGFFLMATVVALLWLFGQHAGTTGMSMLLAGLLLMAVGAWLYGRWGTPMSAPSVRVFAGATAVALVVGGLVVGLGPAQASTPTEAAPTVSGGIRWEPFSPERVAELRAAGRPVFVDFTAAWCLTCQVNERAVLGSERIAARLRDKGVATLKADWTMKDAMITRALAEHGRQGVPLYVVYAPGAGPVLLPEVLTEQIVLDALDF